mgnify:CR=1 FL=1
MTEEGRKGWIRDRETEMQGKRPRGPRMFDVVEHIGELQMGGFGVRIIGPNGEE